LISSHPASLKLILCIDDDPVILSYENALLEGSGYSVITAASAREGLALATTCQFDAVLLDFEMPCMNGCDVACEIKRVRPELPVILLSGSDVPTYALALVDAFILKLEASRELLPTIAALLQRDSLPTTEARKVSAMTLSDKVTNPVTKLEAFTDAELENALARVLVHASGEVLNEAEVQLFYQVYEEICRRSPAVTAA
jgi:CheY-like chemotaxis protein